VGANPPTSPPNRALSAIAQAESLRFKLMGGLAVRRACYGVLKYIMENGAKGCELVISGKLRAQRAKAMKFRDGYMIRSGQAKTDYVDKAVRHIELKQGVLGIKVKIMLPHDPTGREGVATRLPDVVTIIEPKEEEPTPKQPFAQNFLPTQPAAVAAPAPAPAQQGPATTDAPAQHLTQPIA